MSGKVVVFLALFLLAIPSVKSLLVPGVYTSHDLQHHIIRQIDMDKLLSEGQFPPRWSGDLNGGYGYPLFLFNYPLPALIGEVFVKLGLGFIESVKAVLQFSMLMSVVGMYLFLHALLKSKPAAFTGAIFYLYAPVRFIVIYVSAGVGIALALGILPFVFWAITKISQSKSRIYVLAGSLGLFALITSHNVTTMIFYPAILGWSVLLVYWSKDRVFLIKRILLTLALGLGLSAFFWLPAFVEKSFTRYDLILPRFWADHFPTLGQLIRSPWGYGLSHAGVAEDAMSFQIGLVHLAVMLLLVIGLVLFRRKKEFLYLGSFVLIFFAVSVFLMLETSTWFWDNLPILGYVQFPFRFLALAIFSASIAVSLLVKYLPFKKFLFVLLIALVIFANRNHLNVNQRLDLTDKDYITSTLSSTMAGEHLPPWGDLASDLSPGKLEFIDGFGIINITKNQSAQVSASIETQKDSKIKFNQVYFPGWDLKINNENIDFDYLEEGKNYGYPVFWVPQGKSKFSAEFKNTPIRSAADLISLVSVVLFVLLFVKVSIHGKKHLKA